MSELNSQLSLLREEARFVTRILEMKLFRSLKTFLLLKVFAFAQTRAFLIRFLAAESLALAVPAGAVVSR